MKKQLRMLMGSVLLMSALMGSIPHRAEAADNTFMEITTIKRDLDFLTLKVAGDQLITTYRVYAHSPLTISAYSKTGELNWEKTAFGPYAIAEKNFVTMNQQSGLLYIHSTATGEVVKTVNLGSPLKSINKVYLNEKYIVLSQYSRSSGAFYVLDTEGNFVMNGSQAGVMGAALHQNTLVYQDAKGVHSLDLATRRKMWDVPLESNASREESLMPVDGVSYAQGIVRLSEENPAIVKDVMLAIDAATGKVLFQQDFGKYQLSWVHNKDFGMYTSHLMEQKHHFYHTDGKLKMTLDMDTPMVLDQRRKYGVDELIYDFEEKFISSKDGLYYFKRFSEGQIGFKFSSLQQLDDAGRVKFEKIYDHKVFDIATTDSDKLFVAHGKYYNNSQIPNELDVFDSNGVLLDTIETSYIEHLQTDGSTIYGYGGNTLYIFKESEPSKDVTAPSIPTVNAISNKDSVLIGKAEKGAKVVAYVGSNVIGETKAAWGVFSMTIANQPGGATIDVYAIDKAGNKSAKKSIKVADKIAPAVPIVNTIGDNSLTVSGKAESGATVYVYAGTTKLGEAVAKYGSYSVKIAKQKAGTNITVYAIDPAKNKSGSKTVKVADKTAPLAPTVNKITSKSLTVSGKGEKGAIVYVYNGSKKIGTGTVYSSGYFKVKISAQKKGSYVKVILQDKAGNKSVGKTVKVY